MVGSAIGELFAEKMQPIKAKCDEFEQLFHRLQSLSAAERQSPMILPPLRSWSRHDAN